METMTRTGRTMKKSLLGGKGKLTDTTIDKLGGCFGKTIRNKKSGTVEEIRRACMSAFIHVSSSDENPCHECCPPGENSWCFYNKTESLDHHLPSHETMKIKVSLSDDESKRVQEVYKSLTTDQLMSRCLKGRTQNANESVHSKIWSKKPKTNFVVYQACSTQRIPRSQNTTSALNNLMLQHKCL